VERGGVLAVVHAASETAAQAAMSQLQPLIAIGDEPVAQAAVLLRRVN
jgi:thymidine phosphorylase